MGDWIVMGELWVIGYRGARGMGDWIVRGEVWVIGYGGAGCMGDWIGRRGGIGGIGHGGELLAIG